MQDLVYRIENLIFDPFPQNIENTMVTPFGYVVTLAKSWFPWVYTQNTLLKELTSAPELRVASPEL